VLAAFAAAATADGPPPRTTAVVAMSAVLQYREALRER